MEEIENHYNIIEEKDRLESGLGLLEKERTKQIINRFLKGRSLKILDVGGAAGVYAFWIASLGHEVHLIDFTPRHIEQAKRINETAEHKLASIFIGDARNLSAHANESADYILLFGPLYHLVKNEDRLIALKECFRILKPGGKLFAAGINRYASLFDGLSRELIDDPYFVDIMKQDLKNGQHRNPKNHPQYFTTTIFQLPQEMENEITEATFSVLDILPVEGPLWMVPNFEKRWQDDRKKQELLDLANFLEKEKSSLLMTHHYLVVAERRVPTKDRPS